MKKWLYQIRALAIIAVVICHQQGILHSSEYIQLLTLYSVTTLIFLMGYTSALSLKKHKKEISEKGCLSFSLNRLKPALCSYVFASACYLISYGSFTGSQFEVIFSSLLSFSATPPFYFFKYYIVFTLLAPFLMFLCIKIKKYGKSSILLYAVLLFLSFVFGYTMIDQVSCFGGSYLAVYSLGMMLGFEEYEPQHKLATFFIGFFVMCFGLYSTKIFYMNRVAGIYEPSGIDKLVPKLQMNPPNLSICLYSLGVIIVGKIIFDFLNETISNKLLVFILKIFELLGKYSLDIFIWHWLIRDILDNHFIFSNMWKKRICFYTCMFFIPIIIRKLYNELKKDMYNTIA